MEKLVFVIIFGAVALINALIKKGAEKPRGGTPPPPRRNYPPPQPRIQGGETSEEERLRKFMEALGVPTAAAPPPPRIVRPQAQPPRVVPPAVRRQQQVPRQVVARKVFIPAAVSTENYQAETVGSQPPPPPVQYETAGPAAAVAGNIPAVVQPASPGVDFKALLRSPSSIRTAIVLKEILGSPRGLQPFEGAYSQR